MININDIGYINSYIEDIDRPLIKDEEFGYGLQLSRFNLIFGELLMSKVNKFNKELCNKEYRLLPIKSNNEILTFNSNLEEFKTISGRLTKGYRAIENRNFFKEKDTGLILAIYRDPKYEEEVFNMTTGLSYKDFIDKNNYNHILEGDRQENNSTDRKKDCTIFWE